VKRGAVKLLMGRKIEPHKLFICSIELMWWFLHLKFMIFCLFVGLFIGIYRIRNGGKNMVLFPRKPKINQAEI
jgi:hypothetical protein